MPHGPLARMASTQFPWHLAGATIASLALGRFVFLPFHRNSLAKAGLPKQNGKTHFEAGDRLAEEVTFFTSTNDPAGFSLVDVFAWGALGHAAAFYILVSSLRDVDSLLQLSTSPGTSYRLIANS